MKIKNIRLIISYITSCVVMDIDGNNS